MFNARDCTMGRILLRQINKFCPFSWHCFLLNTLEAMPSYVLEKYTNYDLY